MLTLHCRVVPNASKSEISHFEWEDGRLTMRLRLQAPPVDGKANKLLIKFLSSVLGVRKNQITLVAGEKSRDKRLLVDCELEDAELLKRLELTLKSS